MAKLTLSDIVTFVNDVTAKLTYQQNNDLIEAALENTLSRDGTSPNTMSANLDLNSNKAINSGEPTAASDVATKNYVDNVATVAGLKGDKGDTGAAGPMDGPSSSTDGNPALFDSTTGKLLKEGSFGDGLAQAATVVSVDIDTDPGLEFNAGKLRVKITTGIQRLAAGLGLDITGVVALTAPATGDELIVEDVSTSLLKKITLANMLKVINSLTEDTSPVDGDFVASYDLSATEVKKVDLANLVGKTVQMVNTQTGAVSTGTTIIPLDDTIPQNTEGDEYMTLTITPKNTANILLIDVVCNIATPSNDQAVAALFQDTTANALAVAANGADIAQRMSNIKLTHKMTAGTTSATTFKVRANGNDAGTYTFNGQVTAGVRGFGGVVASSITIREYKP